MYLILTFSEVGINDLLLVVKSFTHDFSVNCECFDLSLILKLVCGHTFFCLCSSLLGKIRSVSPIETFGVINASLFY